jgi:hypothetical protein
MPSSMTIEEIILDGVLRLKEEGVTEYSSVSVYRKLKDVKRARYMTGQQIGQKMRSMKELEFLRTERAVRVMGLQTGHLNIYKLKG